MEIKKIQDFSLRDIIVISSLPDMGKVGGLVTQHLAKKLEMRPTLKIILSEKPWVTQKDGLISNPHEEYTLFVNKEKSIAVFTGENQPQEPTSVIEMTEILLESIIKMGNIKLVISTGGYLPTEQGNGNSVYGVATNSKSLEMLKANQVPPLGSEVNSITWFNGLVLGKAKENNIDGVGIFGEILESESPQFKTASNIIKTIEKITNTKIDTQELDDKVIEITPQAKTDGPGIG